MKTYSATQRLKSKKMADYLSQRWRRLSLNIRRRRRFCELCLAENRYKQGRLVDHIVPVNLGGDMWDIKNLQVLCQQCHNEKTKIDGSYSLARSRGAYVR